MRINQVKRIFMNEADASPGNSAPAASPVQPAPTAAPTAPESPTLTVDSVATIVAATVDSKLKAFENGFFANARKAGLLKQDKPPESAPAQPTPSAPAVAHAGLTEADLDARLDARIELERVIAAREAKHGLSEAQARRLRSALTGVSRESLATEADSYLTDLGLVKASTPAPVAVPAQAAPAAAAKPNVSDRGTAAPTDTRDSEGVLNSRPLEMTGHDIDALVLKYGRTKGMEMFQERVLSALGRVRIKPPRG